MSTREDQLGRALRIVFEEEADAMQIDTLSAAARLRRTLSDSSRRRRRYATALAVGVAGVIAVVATIVFTNGRDDSAPISPAHSASTSPAGKDASRPFYLDLSTGEMTPIASDRLSDLLLQPDVSAEVSPDGQSLIWTTCHPGPTGCSGTDQMGFIRLDGSDAHPIRLPNGLNGYGADWSPDGTKVVYQLRDASTQDLGNLYILDVATEKSTQITNFKRDSAAWWSLTPSFSPDGKTIIFDLLRTSSKQTTWDVWSIPVTGGEPKSLGEPPGNMNARAPRYLPDGLEREEMAFIRTSESGSESSIVLADIGGATPLVTTKETIRSFTISPDGSKIAYDDANGAVSVVGVGHNVPDPETAAEQVAFGEHAGWIDRHTLLIVPAR